MSDVDKKLSSQATYDTSEIPTPTLEDLGSAADGIKDSVAAFTYDGDRMSQDHLSGAPVERDLVLGDDDPRDAGLAERPLTEDVVWTGRIFNVDRLQVQLPDGRNAIRDVVRHPGAVAIVALTDEGHICLVRSTVPPSVA